MTPESSEAPREDATGIPVEDREAFIAGNAGELLKDNAVFQRGARAEQTADRAEIGVLAARYADFGKGALNAVAQDDLAVRDVFCEHVRRLAAAVLNQEPAK